MDCEAEFRRKPDLAKSLGVVVTTLGDHYNKLRMEDSLLQDIQILVMVILVEFGVLYMVLDMVIGCSSYQVDYFKQHTMRI